MIGFARRRASDCSRRRERGIDAADNAEPPLHRRQQLDRKTELEEQQLLVGHRHYFNPVILEGKKSSKIRAW